MQRCVSRTDWAFASLESIGFTDRKVDRKKRRQERKKEKIPEKHESGERKKRRTKEWEVRK